MAPFTHTAGIKYAGSKLRLLPHILSLLSGLDIRVVLDGFSGSTRVSQLLAQKNFQVICNDISYYSYIFGLCFLKNQYNHHYFQAYIDHLNHLQGIDGWFSEHYGGDNTEGSAIQADGTKKPWQKHNTRKLDAIRQEIDLMTHDPVERAVLLSSLIFALDEVDNTLGHFSAYLKNWSVRSYKTMHLKVPPLLRPTQNHLVIHGDIFETIKHHQCDLAYFDPPYGSNNEKMPSSRVRYAAYYHLWETICKNDQPNLFGVAKRREDSSDKVFVNPFEDFRKTPTGKHVATETIEQLIKQTQTRYIALSYSSGGKSTARELNDILNSYGKLIKTLEIDCKRNIMSKLTWTNKWLAEADTPNREFLFLIEKYS